MSTTDTRAAFEAWAELTTAQTKGALHEVIGWYYFDDLTNDRWEAWQAATEAAKATGTAVHKLCETFGIKIPEGMTPEMAIACRLKDLEDAVAQASRQPAPSYADMDKVAWSIQERKQEQPAPVVAMDESWLVQQILLFRGNGRPIDKESAERCARTIMAKFAATNRS